MKAKTIFSIVLISLVFAGFFQKLPTVEMETPFGKIVCEIDTVHAPVTAKNFLNHVENGTYENAMFYRVVRPDNQPYSKVQSILHRPGWF